MERRGWFQDDSSTFRLFCTVFPLLLHQLCLRSSETRCQSLGTPDLNDLPSCPGSLLNPNPCHTALLALIQLCRPQGLCTGFSLPGSHMARLPPSSLFLFKYHFPCEGCPSALFKVSCTHTYTHIHVHYLFPLYLPPLAGHIFTYLFASISVPPRKESKLHIDREFCLFPLPVFSSA